MLSITYCCPVDGFPLALAPNGGGYFCWACPPDWGPGQGIDKAQARRWLVKAYPVDALGRCHDWRGRGVDAYAAQPGETP